MKSRPNAEDNVLDVSRRAQELSRRGAPLPEILAGLARAVESLSPNGVLASILLLDDDGLHLRHGAAPSLPAAYTAAIDGLPIGPTVGSCGTAAHGGHTVMVYDIGTDPLWTDYRDLALTHGLRSCWSTPIRSSTGAILGTFALYHRVPTAPTVRDREIVEFLCRAAAVAIERDRGAAG